MSNINSIPQVQSGQNQPQVHQKHDRSAIQAKIQAAVEEYKASHPGCSDEEAQNAVMAQFKSEHQNNKGGMKPAQNIKPPAAGEMLDLTA